MNSRMLWLTALALAAAEPAFPQAYFPVGALPEVAAVRYARFLTAMHEPSLYELSRQEPGAEAYRLLWLRSDRRPASIRFAPKPGGTGWFYRRMTGGTGSTLPGSLRENGMSWSWKSRTASFFAGYRRCWILEFSHWRFRHSGFVSFALDSRGGATRPIPCDRPLLAGGE